MIYDRRCFGNNPEGNPNIAEEGRKWRRQTPNWKEILTKISKERSTGAKTHFGKLKVSLNSRKWSGHMFRLGKESLFIQSIKNGYFLEIAQLLEHKEIEEKIKKIMNKI